MPCERAPASQIPTRLSASQTALPSLRLREEARSFGVRHAKTRTACRVQACKSALSPMRSWGSCDESADANTKASEARSPFLSRRQALGLGPEGVRRDRGRRHLDPQALLQVGINPLALSLSFLALGQLRT